MAKTKLKKIINKTIATLLLIICFGWVYLICVQLIANRPKDLPINFFTWNSWYEAYLILEQEQIPEEPEMTKEEFRAIIEKDFGLKFYIYKERNLKNYSGKCLLEFRTIIIHQNAEGYAYARTFTHESIHLKEYIGDERYVCFKVFTYLYEHKQLHDVGVWYGKQQLTGKFSEERDVSDLIVDYLTNK